MDNNLGGRHATAEEHGIELMRRDLLASMSEYMEAAPKWNNESAGESSCSIFRVPQALAGGNAQACRPRIVSIGPYHHGEPQLQMLQEHKWRYLNTMLDQTQQYGVGLKELIKTVAPKVEMIRQCYSESTQCFSGPDLVKMMVVDGCFIIQFLLQIKVCIPMDPPLDNSYVWYFVGRDLLRLENQVPYFVLEDLFETSFPKGMWSVAELASSFFKYVDVGPGYDLGRQINIKGVHLLDLFRLNLIPQGQQVNQANERSYCVWNRSASELRRVGIGFKRGQASNFLGIEFDSERRTIRIPQIAIDDDLNCILPNMVAFEQCRGQSDKHITAYAAFMGCLIHTADDVQLLRDRKIISNHGMSNQDVACFFGDICKGASIVTCQTYLASHFSFLESCKYEKAYFCWAQLLNAFQDNPWSALSGLALVVTLVGIIQTVYAVLQYYHPNPK